jgi:hypothetical protein
MKLDKQLNEMAERDLNKLMSAAERVLKPIADESGIDIKRIGKLLSGVKIKSQREYVLRTLRQRKVDELLATLSDG